MDDSIIRFYVITFTVHRTRNFSSYIHFSTTFTQATHARGPCFCKSHTGTSIKDGFIVNILLVTFNKVVHCTTPLVCGILNTSRGCFFPTFSGNFDYNCGGLQFRISRAIYTVLFLFVASFLKTLRLFVLRFFNRKVYNLEAFVQSCSVKKVLLSISQNSRESSCARVSFWIKLQALGTGVFLWVLGNF